MHHTLVALVEDKPGVLNRVALVFRRRAFNIESLTVGRTAEPGVSRMTIVLDSDQTSAERVTAYLYKLVNVLQVEDLGTVPAVARDLLSDPQTSGGLLVSCDPNAVGDVLAVFRDQGFDEAAVIGSVREGVGLRVVP